jgi:hypothetical protein
MTLAQLGRVGNDRANAESTPEKTVERGRCASVIVDLLNPAPDKANAQPVLESATATSAAVIDFVFIGVSFVGTGDNRVNREALC